MTVPICETPRAVINNITAHRRPKRRHYVLRGAPIIAHIMVDLANVDALDESARRVEIRAPVCVVDTLGEMPAAIVERSAIGWPNKVSPIECPVVTADT